MAWVKPFKLVVKVTEVPLPHWMNATPERKDYILVLECGHEVKRHAYSGKLPKKCRCTKCSYNEW
jgi:hypothetical protein